MRLATLDSDAISRQLYVCGGLCTQEAALVGVAVAVAVATTVATAAIQCTLSSDTIIGGTAPLLHQRKPQPHPVSHS
jgi:hypothetical protein